MDVSKDIRQALAEVWFVSFADSRLRPSLARLRAQAAEFGFETGRSAFWTERDLDSGFVRRMGDLLSADVRGFGYWCWKPQVWLQMLERMPEDAVMLYLDAGCHLNRGGRQRFVEYLGMMERTDLLTFQSKSFQGTERPDVRHHFAVEREWAKGDLLDFFGVRGNAAVTETGQIVGGVVLMRNTPRMREFVRRFRDFFYDHFELADDTPSRSPNAPGFRENRHDQSVFSILCKLEGYDRYSLSGGELYPVLRDFPSGGPTGPDNRKDWGFSDFSEMSAYPIHVRRDKRRSWTARLFRHVHALLGARLFEKAREGRRRTIRILGLRLFSYERRKPQDPGRWPGNDVKAAPPDCRIRIFGTGNMVVFHEPVDPRFSGCIDIGSPDAPAKGCRVEIGGGCTANGIAIRLMENDSVCTFGRDCMLSEQVKIWASDTHAMTDADGAIVNRGRFVTVGEHVWIGYGATVLKNTSIPDGSVIGSQSVVAGSRFGEPNSVIAGNPARVIRTGMTWHRSRVNQMGDSEGAG